MWWCTTIISAWLLACASATTRPEGGGPRQFFKPNIGADAGRKLREEVEQYQKKQQQLGDPSSSSEEAAPPQLEDAPESTDASADLPASKVVARSSLAGVVLRRARLPLAVGAVGFAVHHTWVSRLASEVDAELHKLAKMTGIRHVDPPSPLGRRNLRDHRAALTELRARSHLLASSVLPLLRQLELERPPDAGAPLTQRSSAELAALNTSLTERVASCGALLAEYEALGQPPPPTFRSWATETLGSRLDNPTSKRAELQAIVALQAQLGRQRMEASLPEWSAAALREHAAALAAEVEEVSARKHKARLLGKVEAELWRRGEEAPVALATLTAEKLEALLAKLKGAPKKKKTKVEAGVESEAVDEADKGA